MTQASEETLPSGEREIRGRWWLAERTARSAVPGTLVVRADRSIRLYPDTELRTGELQGPFVTDLTTRVPFQRILGRTTERRERLVTLDRAFETNDGWLAHTACIGAAFREAEPIMFREARINLSHLNEWANTNGIKHRQKDFDSYAIEWRRPDPHVAVLPDETRIEIAFDVDAGWHGSGIREAHLTQSAELRILFPELAELEEVQRVANTLRNLVSLCAQRALRIERIRAYPAPVRALHERLARSLRQAGRRRRIYEIPETEIVYAMVERRGDERPFNELRSPFTLTEVEQGFDTLVNRWFPLVERLDDVVNLYLSTVHAPPHYPETQFLIFAQALEGYHRVTADRTVWPDAEWASIRSTLAAGLDDRVARKLRGKIDQLNYVSLSSRLSDLMKRAPATTRRILEAGRTTKGEFLEAVEKTRNTLAHSIDPRPPKAARDADLWRLTAQLQALVETMLFLDVGFTDDVIADRLPWRGDRYWRIRTYAQD